MAESNVEADSTFTCMICLDYATEPLNCRYCSNFVCAHCINNWFQHNTNNGVATCPTCRNVVQRNEFIKLVWLPEHLKRINDQTKEFERTKLNECSQHAKQELCIYCSTCSKPICTQCILSMFNGEHIDHIYSRLDAAQQRLLKAIDKQEKNLKSDLDQLDICIQNKKFSIDQILTQRKERLNELEQFQTNIKTQIELKITKDLEQYHDEQKILIEEKIIYEKKYTRLKETIESYNQIELFEQEKELLQQISQRPKLPTVDKVDLPDDIVGSPLALPWQTGELVIEQFLVKRQKNERISSPQIRLDHNQYWTLTIYPNGKGPDIGDYLSVMLQLKKGMSQSIDYNIIIELIHHHYDDKRHNYTLTNTQSFKEGQSYRYYQFYKLNDLSNDGFLNLETDSIKFRFKLCPKSIFEERKLLQWQIQCFEQNRDEQNKEMNKIIDELTNLRQLFLLGNRIIEDQRIKINKLKRHNSEVKRKRTRSNHDDRNEFINHEDRRSNSNQARTIIFSNEKRVRK